MKTENFENPLTTVSRNTGGINVTVDVIYSINMSNPLTDGYTFIYRVVLENKNDFAVKILKRNWFTFDSAYEKRGSEMMTIEFEQPVIEAHRKFEFFSECHLKSAMGQIHGNFTVQNLNNKKYFEIDLPLFEMIAPLKMN